MKVTRCVRKLTAYTPGEQPKDKNVVKLNTNENPYPPSPRCAAVLKRFDLDLLRRYPNPVSLNLRRALAKLNGTRIENIFVGNGSDEILSLATRAFVENNENIASLDPSYSLYKTLAAIRDVKWTDRPNRQTALFLWTNPNAPTGTLVEPKVIAAFQRTFKGIIIVDEAYADFSRTNCMKLAKARGNTNLIVMRTFSKSYSLAGLRVGYCVGPKELIDALYKIKDSYNVDALAQAVALVAVEDQAWMKRNVAKVIEEREKLTNTLRASGWDVLPSESNFIYARPPRLCASKIFTALRARKIFVRYFPGPKTGDRIRITIGTRAQMKTLLTALKEMKAL